MLCSTKIKINQCIDSLKEQWYSITTEHFNLCKKNKQTTLQERRVRILQSTSTNVVVPFIIQQQKNNYNIDERRADLFCAVHSHKYIQQG